MVPACSSCTFAATLKCHAKGHDTPTHHSIDTGVASRYAVHWKPELRIIMSWVRKLEHEAKSCFGKGVVKRE